MISIQLKTTDTIMSKLLTFFKKKKKSNKDPFDYQGITENIEL